MVATWSFGTRAEFEVRAQVLLASATHACDDDDDDDDDYRREHVSSMANVRRSSGAMLTGSCGVYRIWRRRCKRSSTCSSGTFRPSMTRTRC
eukprot:522877-Rhodomonas_salina.1